MTKIVSKPQMNETSSILFLDFKLTPTKIGKIGNMQGDNTEITPVKKEMIGNISI